MDQQNPSVETTSNICLSIETWLFVNHFGQKLSPCHLRPVGEHQMIFQNFQRWRALVIHFGMFMSLVQTIQTQVDETHHLQPPKKGT